MAAKDGGESLEAVVGDLIEGSQIFGQGFQIGFVGVSFAKSGFILQKSFGSYGASPDDLSGHDPVPGTQTGVEALGEISKVDAIAHTGSTVCGQADGLLQLFGLEP